MKDRVEGSQHLLCLTVNSECASQICKTVQFDDGSTCETELVFYATPSSGYEIEAQGSGVDPFNYV